MRNGQAGTVKTPHGGDLVLPISDAGGVRGLFGFEDGIDAFGGNNGLILVSEDEGRVLTVEDDNVDLLAETPAAVDDVGFGRLVPFRQIQIQHADPDALTC